MRCYHPSLLSGVSHLTLDNLPLCLYGVFSSDGKEIHSVSEFIMIYASAKTVRVGLYASGHNSYGFTGKLRNCRRTYMPHEAIAQICDVVWSNWWISTCQQKVLHTTRSFMICSYDWKESALRAATLQRRLRLPQVSNIISRNGSSVLRAIDGLYTE